MSATLKLVHVVAWQEYLERENLNHIGVFNIID